MQLKNTTIASIGPAATARGHRTTLRVVRCGPHPALRLAQRQRARLDVPRRIDARRAIGPNGLAARRLMTHLRIGGLR